MTTAERKAQPALAAAASVIQIERIQGSEPEPATGRGRAGLQPPGRRWRLSSIRKRCLPAGALETQSSWIPVYESEIKLPSQGQRQRTVSGIQIQSHGREV